MTWLGLIRYHVLFAIDIASGKVEILGMAANPGGPWMQQMARNLVDTVDGFQVGKRYVLIDRDPLYTEAFRRILGQGGVKAVRLPARSPNLNAFAERFVLSIKSECLDRIVSLGEAHLRRAISEYVVHCHQERNHQGIENRLIASDGRAESGVGLPARSPQAPATPRAVPLPRHTPRYQKCEMSAHTAAFSPSESRRPGGLRFGLCWHGHRRDGNQRVKLWRPDVIVFRVIAVAPPAHGLGVLPQSFLALDIGRDRR